MRTCTGDVCVRSTRPAVGVADEEGVHHRPGRVVGPDVERVEVEPLRLDLGALGDLVAHGDEDVLDPLLDRGERVACAGRAASVGSVTSTASSTSIRASRSASSSACRAAIAAVICLRAAPTRCPAAALRGGRQGADLAVGQRERRTVAGVREAGRLERVEVGLGGDVARAAATLASMASGCSAATSTGSKLGLGIVGRFRRCGHAAGVRGAQPNESARARGDSGRQPRAEWRTARTGVNPRHAVSLATSPEADQRDADQRDRWARALAYRHTAAALATLRLSARPYIGIRTRRSAAARIDGGQPVRLGAEQPRRSGPASAPRSASVVEVAVTAAGWRRASRSRRREPGPAAPRVAQSTTGRWNRLPALDRTALPLYGSTPPSTNTASAPAASAVRMIVPALPGSLGSTSAATQPRPAGEHVVRRAGTASRRPRPGPAGSPSRTGPPRPCR